jgi:hypothetical protein
MKPHEHLLKRSGFPATSVSLRQKFALDGVADEAGALTNRSRDTRQLNRMPIQCDGFSIKSCSRGLRKHFRPSLAEETWIEVDKGQFVFNNGIRMHRYTYADISRKLNDGNMAQTACTIQCKLCIKRYSIVPYFSHTVLVPDPHCTPKSMACRQ